jgi:2'-5' RNA ligase/predicted kinase
VFLYIPLPHQLAKQFPERKYPPHITVLHVGDLTRSQWVSVLPVIDEILETTPPFELAMTEFGVFAPKYGDYIYPHMQVQSTGLEALHHRLRNAIRDLRITVKHYGFTPHATLDKVDRDEIYVGPRPTEAWLVEDIVLVGFEDYTYHLGIPDQPETEERLAIIMRGIPGAGKTTYLQEYYPDAEIVSADDFHTRHGVYQFRADKAWLAHKLCYDNYVALLEAGMPTVAVDNTNITKSEVSRYRQAAIQRGYQPLVITVLETPEKAFHAGIHNVPREKVYEMARKLDRTRIPEDWDHLIVDYT